MLRIRRPFLISFFGMMISCILLMTGFHSLLWCITAALSGLFLFFIIRKSAVSKALLILLAGTLLSLSVFNFSDTIREKEETLAGYEKEITGTITDINYDSKGHIQSALLSDCGVDNKKIYGKIKIYPDKEIVFSYGDKLKITANELYISEGAGIFRYHSLSDRCRLSAFFQAKNCTVTQAEPSLYTSILKFRSHSAEKLRATLGYNAFGISQALFTGSQDNLSPELSVAFRICGISHIFAVSGMHLSLWTGMFFLIFKRRSMHSFVPNISASLFVVFYIVFTGFSPSVLRSGIMLIFVFMGRILRRHADTLNSLGIAGTVLLTINPYLAGNISFILSFTATGAIAFWEEYILPDKKGFHGFFRNVKNKLLNPIYNTVTAVTVMLTVLPAISLFFGYTSLLSPITSLVITPLAEAIMIISSFIVLLPSGNILYSRACDLSEFLCDSMTYIVTELSEADFMLFPVKPSVLIPIFIIVSILCVLFLVFFSEKKKAFACILSGVLLFTGLTTADIYSHRDETEIKIFGKENATLIALTDHNGTCAIIGSGGSSSLISEFSRYLGNKGIVKADLLLIPRERDTENKNTSYLQKSHLPQSTVKAYEHTSPVNINLPDNIRILSYTTHNFSAVALFINSTKIIICPYPSSDFTERDPVFSQGDILICRSNIPETLDTGAFSDVIIVTDSVKEHLSSFISTIDKNLTITVKGDSYAVY